MANRTRVLLVDDDALFAEGVKALLANDDRIDVVGVARDGEQAVDMAAELAPDLVLMDIAMPGVDGVEATRRIGDCCPGARIVMLTGREGREDEVASGEAGAVGYLRKKELYSPHVADSLIALVELS